MFVETKKVKNSLSIGLCCLVFVCVLPLDFVYIVSVLSLYCLCIVRHVDYSPPLPSLSGIITPHWVLIEVSWSNMKRRLVFNTTMNQTEIMIDHVWMESLSIETLDYNCHANSIVNNALTLSFGCSQTDTSCYNMFSVSKRLFYLSMLC